VEGIQEEDPGNEEPGIPWVLIPGGIVVVLLDDTRPVQGTVQDDGQDDRAEDEAEIRVHGVGGSSGAIRK